jgi:hypothetical protein
VASQAGLVDQNDKTDNYVDSDYGRPICRGHAVHRVLYRDCGRYEGVLISRGGSQREVVHNTDILQHGSLT